MKAPGRTRASWWPASGVRDQRRWTPTQSASRRPGWPALVFDYRHFGDSDGQPRQLLDIGRQLDDWRAAIAFARSLEELDGDRIGLWGTSFSGAHAVAVAEEDERLRAVVSQVPFTDGRAPCARRAWRRPSG